jgi:hypothetical protein
MSRAHFLPHQELIFAVPATRSLIADQYHLSIVAIGLFLADPYSIFKFILLLNYSRKKIQYRVVAQLYKKVLAPFKVAIFLRFECFIFTSNWQPDIG